MRVEIDLPNPKDLLCDGMYGKATITLERDTKNLTVPPACVVEHVGRNHGVVYVVRDGIARRTEVKLGGDNGSLAEILSGIGPDDAVVFRSGAPVEDGIARHFRGSRHRDVGRERGADACEVRRGPPASRTSLD